jgi:hypothetical protein
VFNLRGGFLARLIRWSRHTPRTKRRTRGRGGGGKGPCRPELQMRTSPILRYTRRFGSLNFHSLIGASKFPVKVFCFSVTNMEIRKKEDLDSDLCIDRLVLSYDCPNAILAVHKWFVESRDWTSTLGASTAGTPPPSQAVVSVPGTSCWVIPLFNSSTLGTNF